MQLEYAEKTLSTKQAMDKSEIANWLLGLTNANQYKHFMTAMLKSNTTPRFLTWEEDAT